MTRRIVRLTLLLIAAWCVMTLTHECGHIVCGSACGGTLQEAEIAPWSLPYSRFEPDPQPLITAWGGPLLGVLVPLTVALLIRKRWAWFIAWFCMIANGSYITFAWLTGEPYLDTAKLLRHGARPMTIGVYCVITIIAGYLGFRNACYKELRQ